MITRRDFLKHLGIIAVPAIVAPKLIFDVGKNAHKLRNGVWYRVECRFERNAEIVATPEVAAEYWRLWINNAKSVEFRRTVYGWEIGSPSEHASPEWLAS